MNLSNPRENLLQTALSLKGNHWIFELATGTGKSKIAIEKIKQLCDGKDYSQTILIVVPRNIHKQNWKDEIYKWWPECTHPIIYTTYVSLPKYKSKWDYIIFDECHHLSDRCKEAVSNFKIRHALFLSATINRELKSYLCNTFSGMQILKADLRNVIDDGILPDPKVYLIPLKLGNEITECICKNPKATGTPIETNWTERWSYKNVKNIPIHIRCTEQQYLQDLNNQIEWWKSRYKRTRNEGVKTKWLKLCNDRLIWLSRKKDNIVLRLLDKLSSYRTLTFCSGISQTEVLGSNCINSKNSNSEYILKEFNNEAIHHITACNMLNEGINLYNCQIGIYANVNSSEVIVKQRAGRLLRHRNPVIIIPYFKFTREEELVKKMLENYNPKLVRTVNFIEEIVI